MSSDKKLICPHLQKECIKDGTIVIVDGKPELHACPAWVCIAGKNPQSEEIVNQWNCSQFHWAPLLMIENSQQQRQTAAAVESLRNESVAIGQQIAGALWRASGNNPMIQAHPIEACGGGTCNNNQPRLIEAST